MTPIAQILQEKVRLQTRKHHHRGTEWTELVQFFQEEINKERRGTKYKPLSFMAVRNKVSHLDIGTLYWFKSVATDYKNRNGSLSKFFFGSLKIK